jgi:hypothetical protein
MGVTASCTPFHGDWCRAKTSAEPPVVRTGNELWTRRFPADIDAVAIGRDGSIVISGGSVGIVDFGDGMHPKRAFGPDNFVARFDGEGKTLWSRYLGEPVKGRAVAVDDAGNAFVVGETRKTVDLGTGALEIRGRENAAFAVKLAPNGNTLWARLFEGRDSFAFGVAVAGRSGGVVVGVDDGGLGRAIMLEAGGRELWTTELGRMPTSGRHVRLASNARGDIAALWEQTEPFDEDHWKPHVALLDVGGRIVWNRTFEADGAYGSALSIGERGEVTVVGQRAGKGEDVSMSGFVARFAADGQLVWAERLARAIDPLGAATDTDSGLVMVGRGLVGLEVCGQPRVGADGTAFRAKLGRDGKLVWIVPMTLPKGHARNVALTPSGDLVTIGDSPTDPTAPLFNDPRRTGFVIRSRP